MGTMTAVSQARRVDLELVARGLAPSRERAQALIAAGLVEVDGARAISADQRVVASTPIRLLGRDHPWASRGGLKLAPGLDEFGIDCRGRVCLDAGASTGGFTDVLLSRGASVVYAVDVGRGQLDPRLATDARVRVMDRTNIRSLMSLPSGPAPDLVTLDLSFISLRLVMPAVVRLIAPAGADLVALFKPQFELGRGYVGKGGVVGDTLAAERAATEFARWLESEFGAVALEPMESPVRGAKGNHEWLVGARLTHVETPEPGES